MLQRREDARRRECQTRRARLAQLRPARFGLRLRRALQCWQRISARGCSQHSITASSSACAC
jgi:hypothetical protein